MILWGNLIGTSYIHDVHKILISWITNSKKFCPYIFFMFYFFIFFHLNTKVYMLFRVRQKDKNHRYHHCPHFVFQFYFRDFFLNFSRRLNFANISFRDMSSEINFAEKVEIQSAPFNHSTQDMQVWQ